ncbi:MAG: TfoX/Sxy family protein [Chloroflexi bacterium]|nr:TfoX/Sxy family protein [Chloroflexota bacterium]
MACTDEYIQYVLEQLSPAGEVSARKMFGEYGLYMDGKVIGLICDNQVFLKKTEAAADLLGDEAEEGFAYPGAKASYVFENLDDQDFVVQVFRASWEQIPFPKPKKPRK